MSADAMDKIAVERFVDYLKIKTVQPNPDYAGAVTFLKNYSKELGLECKVVEVHPNRPIVITTWKGTGDSKLGSICLNSHIDVVPVDEEKWSHPPFEAKIVDGKIFARGSQDMKIVGLHYMEAIRRLKANNFTPKRTVHLTFVPDEEIGGLLGMKLFVKRQEFKDLNVAFALDEGCPSLTNEVPVFYGERAPWWIHVKCKGTPGHASMLKPDTAGEKFWRFTDKMMSYREGQKHRFDWSYEKHQEMGERMSVNLTMVNGGKQPNVIPSELTAIFDVRIPPTIDLAKWEAQLNKWAVEVSRETGGPDDGIEITYSQKEMIQAMCNVNDDKASPFWSVFSKTLVKHGMTPKLSIFPAATDCRYIRDCGIPALGFSALPETPFLLHDHDEYVSVDTYLKGIKTYEDIIKEIVQV